MRGEVPGKLAQALAAVCRDRRTGAIRLQRDTERLRLLFKDGRIVDVDSRAEARPVPTTDDAEDPALLEIFEGLGRRQRQPGPPPGRRERILAALSWPHCSCYFDDEPDAPTGGNGIGLSTGQLIAEVIRRMEPPTVRAALGDLARVLVLRVDPTRSTEPLTLAEHELLGRVNGARSIGAVLEAGGPREEAERSLLCLILRGLVGVRAAPGTGRTGPVAVASPEPAPPAAEPEALEELRREIQKGAADLHRKDHFEVLGVPEVTSPAGIDEAYRRLSRRLDPAACAHPSLDDLRADIEALRLRVEGAYRVLSEPASRAAYEAQLTRRKQEVALAERPGPRLIPNTQELALRIEERLHEADRLLANEQCWDAMQLLGELMPLLPPGRQQRRAQVLLARAYVRNPKWARRAEELLLSVVSADPASVDAYLTLGSLYKTRGLQSRATTMFRKVLDLQPGHPAAALELPTGPLQRLLGRH